MAKRNAEISFSGPEPSNEELGIPSSEPQQGAEPSGDVGDEGAGPTEDEQLEQHDQKATEVTIPQRPSRRAEYKRLEELEKGLGEIRKKAGRVDELEGSLSDLRRQNAEQAAELQRLRSAPPAAASPAAQGVSDEIDPAAMLKAQTLQAEALAKLKAGDVDGYHNGLMKVNAVLANAAAQKHRPAPAAAEPQLPPWAQALRARYAEQLADPDFEAVVRYHAAKLKRAGVHDDATQAKRAFAAAAKEFAGDDDAPPERSKAERAAMSGSPPARGSSGEAKGEEVIRLPKDADGKQMTIADVNRLAKSFGISPAAYLKQYKKLHPDAVVRR